MIGEAGVFKTKVTKAITVYTTAKTRGNLNLAKIKIESRPSENVNNWIVNKLFRLPHGKILKIFKQVFITNM